MNPTTRKRLYETGALILSALVVWGVVTADEAAQYTDALDKLLGIGLLLLARRNVPSDVQRADSSWGNG